MISAYDKKTGDGQWFRQSLQILQEAISELSTGKKTVAQEDERADANADRNDANGCNPAKAKTCGIHRCDFCNPS